MVSPDLDIFGDSQEENREADEASMDIFGDSVAQEAEAESSESEENESVAGAESESGEGEPDWASIFWEPETVAEEGEGTEGKEAEGDEQLDEEIDELLTKAGEEDDKDERDDIISQLRQKLVDQQVEIDSLSRHRDVLNEKLMSSSSADTELGMYKDVISRLESNPKLRALVRYSEMKDEAQKNRAVTILADLLEEATGQDVSSLLDKSRSDKAKAALGAAPSPGSPGKGEKEDKNLDYESSTSQLW